LVDLPSFNTPAYAQLVRDVEEKHPIITHGTDLAGSLALQALGLGGPGIASKAGRLVQGALTGEGLAARALGGAAGAMAEASFYGPGMAGREALIRDKPLTADLLWSNTAGMAGVAALFGGPLAMVGKKGAGKAVAETQEALKPAAELTVEDALQMAKARWGDNLHPRVIDHVRAATAGGKAKTWAALRELPEWRRFLDEGQKDEWLTGTARKLADLATETAHGLESAQMHSGKLKFQNAVPHLDAITAPRASAAAENKINEVRMLLEGTLNHPAYREGLAATVSEGERRGLLVQSKMDDAIERLRALDLAEELDQAKLPKMDADIRRYVERLSQAEGAQRDQLAASVAIRDIESRQLADRVASYPKRRAALDGEVTALQKELDGLQASGVPVKGSKIEGQGQLRRYLGHVRSAQARVEAETDPIRRAAKAFAEADALKSASGSLAKPGKVLGHFDHVPNAFRKANDMLRTHLEDAGVWGERLAAMQSKVNAPFHRQLNVAFDVMGKFFADSGVDSAYSTWYQSKIGSSPAFRGLLDNLANARGDVDTMKLRQYLENGVETSRALRGHYAAMDAGEAARLAAAEKSGIGMLRALDEATDTADFLNQMRFIMRQPDEATRQLRIGAAMFGGMFGGPAGAAAGWLIGQRLMHTINPAPRLTTLARVEGMKEFHDTWQSGVIRSLLGGGRGRPGKPVTTRSFAKPKQRAYVRLSKPLAASLLYEWGAEPEDGRDKQKVAERTLDKFRAALHPANGDAMKAGVAGSLGTFGAENPEIVEQMTAKTKLGIKKIVDAAPQRPPSDTLFPSLFQSPWPRTTALRIEQTAEAVFDPYTTLEKLATGTVTPEQMDILNELHPAMVTGFKVALIQAINSERPPSRKVRRQLAIVLGVPVDPSTDPEYIAHMQMLHAERAAAYQEATKAPKRKTYRPTGVTLGNAAATSLTRIEKGEPPR